MITVRSPAKINLFLHVMGRRPDGYHNLSTLMQAVSLYDTLQIAVSDGIDRLTCTDPSLSTDSTNLVMKAVELYRQKTGITHSFTIHLDKCIPHQAGLGGGSSNAATTLWAVNRLCGDVATEEQLRQWSGEIGSDVSFFFSSGSAYCTSRGEEVQSLAPLPMPTGHTAVVIFKPPVNLSTGKVFAVCEGAPPAHDPITALAAFQRGQGHCVNALEAASVGLAPELLKIRDTLVAAGLDHVTMTGSGSAFYGFGTLDDFVIPGASRCRFINRTSTQWY